FKAELPGRGAVEQPASQDARVDQGAARDGKPLPIEGPRPQAALAQRIVDDGDGRIEQRLPKAVEQEAGPAGDGRTGDAADQMTDKAGADARIEDDRHDPAFDTDGVEAGDGAMTRALADFLRMVEIFEMAGAVAGMVALHVRPG